MEPDWTCEPVVEPLCFESAGRDRGNELTD